jgi:hypothetical protein
MPYPRPFSICGMHVCDGRYPHPLAPCGAYLHLADLRGVTAMFGLSIADNDMAIFRPAGPSIVVDRRMFQDQRPHMRRGRGAMHLVACRLIAAW